MDTLKQAAESRAQSSPLEKSPGSAKEFLCDQASEPDRKFQVDVVSAHRIKCRHDPDLDYATSLSHPTDQDRDTRLRMTAKQGNRMTGPSPRIVDAPMRLVRRKLRKLSATVRSAFFPKRASTRVSSRSGDPNHVWDLAQNKKPPRPAGRADARRKNGNGSPVRLITKGNKTVTTP